MTAADYCAMSLLAALVALWVFAPGLGRWRRAVRMTGAGVL